MPSSSWRQFSLLLWKNYLLQRRSYLLTALELGLPCFFALILIAVRPKVESTYYPNVTSWDAFNVDGLPFKLCPKPGFPFSCSRWRMFYAPDNNTTKRVITNLNDAFVNRIQPMQGFESESAMVSAIMADFKNRSSATDSDILGGLVFHSLDQPSNLTYSIRLVSTGRIKSRNPFAGSNGWKTNLMFPQFQQVGPRSSGDKYGGEPGYYAEGFLALQHAVDSALTDLWAPDAKLPKVLLKRHPYPPYLDDKFVMVLQNQFPFILLLSFIFPALIITMDLVHEKERRLKESMKMMGLSGWLHGLAWFTKYFVFLLISVTIITVLFSIPIGTHGSIIGFTAPSVLLVFLLAYSAATISFGFMIAAFFSKANSAAAASGILFFISYIPYSFLQPRYSTLPWAAKIAASIVSNIAMPLGALVISMFEGTGAGVQWSTLNQGSSVDDNFSLLDVILCLLGDTVLYLVIAWYVEAVRPGEFGVPQKWYFPITKSYWCGSTVSSHDHPEFADTTPLLGSQSHETEPTDIQAGIQIQGLTKEFGDGNKKLTAVNNMTLNMYEGQITALLGHNGAGKTTTMSMLTGFLPPTRGTAHILGHDIRRDMAQVRHSLGLCPQHDVLFDNLTVSEHMRFFTQLKGVPSSEVNREVDTMLEAVNLSHKHNALAKTLSGGMKRKLSVAIALCGGSKVVILDEPTSGMDPAARRSLWDVLLQHRQGRTILLSTHFMDEADVLGDRIAIMADGVVQCSGSPLFLKHKYGAGYHVVMVKRSSCDVAAVSDMVKSYVPAAYIESNISAELTYVLPHESKSHFEELFIELEKRKESLGVASYGASVSTMEEVFLKVGDQVAEEKLSGSERSARSLASGSASSSSRTPLLDSQTTPNVSGYGAMDGTGETNPELYDLPVSQRSVNGDDHITTSFEASKVKNSGITLCLQQFRAMFTKRVLHTARNLILAISQLLVPLFFVTMALVVIKTIPGPQDAPPLSLDLTHFDSNVVAYRKGDNKTIASNLSSAYASLFPPSLYPGVDLVYVNNASSSVIDMEQFLVQRAEQNIAEYNNHYLLAGDFLSETATAFFSGQAYHTPGITLSAVGNALLRYASGLHNASISVLNHPLPRTIKEEMGDLLIEGFEGGVISFNMMFGMSFLASSFAVFLIKERSVKSKHIQFVSGVRAPTFWLATFAWDLINFLFPCIFLLVIFAAFNVEAYVGGGRIWYVLLLLLLYGWAVLPLMYILSFLFTAPAAGLVWLTMFNILSGVVTVVTVDILMIPQLNLTATAEGLNWGFLSTGPNYCLGQGILTIYSNHQFLNICLSEEIKFACQLNISNPCCKGNCGSMCLDYNENYLAWEAGGIGRFLAFLAIQGLMYFMLLAVIESQFFEMAWYRISQFANRFVTPRPVDDVYVEDDDVAKERQRISTSDSDMDTIVIDGLCKAYGRLLAVDSVSAGIPAGECFGLLGVNGAGKTSTFKMLTGDEMVTDGNAYLNGYSVRFNIAEVQRQLGYCPQFDALIEQMSGRETLVMFARLRGVPETAIASTVTRLLDALLLRPYADVLVKAYSGGTKRKLSVAIALVGGPPVVFLDEPSTGMDPVARRHLWNALASVRHEGCTLVLTSHSMEECEALCTRLAIMVNGQFRCLGAVQHLKNKFGEGFTLMARVNSDNTTVSRLMQFISTAFPSAQLKDVHQGTVHYHIRDASIPLHTLFGQLERAKQEYCIEDYSVSQTTLEQVFINFARSQVAPSDDSPTGAGTGCCRNLGLLCCCCCGRGGCCHGDAQPEQNAYRASSVAVDSPHQQAVA